MSPQVGFVTFLLATVLLLCGVVWSGMRARVPLHLTLVAAAVASLGVTIYFAPKLGDLYDLEAAGWITPFHLTLAKITTASYVLPLASGVMTLRDRRHRRAHLVLAMLTLAMTAITALTGTWMILAAPRIA